MKSITVDYVKNDTVHFFYGEGVCQISEDSSERYGKEKHFFIPTNKTALVVMVQGDVDVINKDPDSAWCLHRPACLCVHMSTDHRIVFHKVRDGVMESWYKQYRLWEHIRPQHVHTW